MLSIKDQFTYNRIIEEYQCVLNKLVELDDSFTLSPQFDIHIKRFGYCLGLIKIIKGITKF